MGPFTETKWIVCHNGSGVIHYVILEPGTIMETGQPYCEGFADRDDALARAIKLGYVLPIESTI
jgi:hypothetical protein